ncbi:hypothetical protein M6D81_14380 [Paenibacillus sp. J5C_2022]|uniref:hypothetical protein n=1 Tax=Paenibacillus sp. J5C2022 TaxID=2977129 RepID=UPI0021D3930E|nr:hypothetical protein [Paenibacillus sp. J5C2022]MCU6709878.1 hypothetical protein [Paenibacillus sp. J5C2022]
MANPSSSLRIGWAEGDITPEHPVILRGMFYARVSEGIMDPLSVTGWALESEEGQAVLVSCDLLSVPEVLREEVRARLDGQLPDLDPMNVIISATHTHTGPEIYAPSADYPNRGIGIDVGVELEAMNVNAYISFAAERIAEVIRKAWNARTPGSLAYGMDYAVVGRNRRWIDEQGRSTMYGLHPEVSHTFRHIEGYEDHSINLAATYDCHGKLTGLVVNVPCPSQESETLFVISADWWSEARQELRQRFGGELFILPQCSAAGDLSPFLLYDNAATARMQELKGQSPREEIAQRIANAVQEILPVIAQTAVSSPVLRHHVETLEVPANRLTEDDVRTARHDVERFRLEYEEEMRKLEADPSLRSNPRWYVAVTDVYRRMNWHLGVVRRFELQRETPTIPAEIHVLRIGDIAFTTVPYEYYLDYGIQIKVRNEGVAVQTFLIQLAGGGTYLPSQRSLAGGGYGSVPASNPVGPEGGQAIVEHTVGTVGKLFRP